MFEGMKNLKNLASLMGNPGQVQELREKFEKLREELGRRTTEADAGAGAVRVVANGNMEIVRVQLDPVMVRSLAGDPADEQAGADRELIEELIVSATNEALRKAQEMVRDEMGKLSGGLDIPGMGGPM